MIVTEKYNILSETEGVVFIGKNFLSISRETVVCHAKNKLKFIWVKSRYWFKLALCVENKCGSKMDHK